MAVQCPPMVLMLFPSYDYLVTCCDYDSDMTFCVTNVTPFWVRGNGSTKIPMRVIRTVEWVWWAGEHFQSYPFRLISKTHQVPFKHTITHLNDSYPWDISAIGYLIITQLPINKRRSSFVLCWAINNWPLRIVDLEPKHIATVANV